MSILCDKLSRVLPPGMTIPDPIRKLYVWMEQTGRTLKSVSGEPIGILQPARPGGNPKIERGTNIVFAAEGNINLHYWFGHDRPEVINRLCVFAQTGTDGSMAAFWIDDDGVQRIVHLGSGSGSTTVCVLAEEAVDFLRFLAIGYEEVCWGRGFSMTPQEAAAAQEVSFVGVNETYNDWVVRTFSTTIPQRGIEIVPHPDEMNTADPKDRFCRWVNANL